MSAGREWHHPTCADMRNTTHKVREATHNKRKVNGGLGCRGGGGAFLTNSNFLLQNKNEFSTYNIRGVDVRAGRQLDQQRLGMPFQRRPLSSRTWDNISIIPPHVRETRLRNPDRPPPNHSHRLRRGRLRLYEDAARRFLVIFRRVERSNASWGALIDEDQE